MCAIRYDDFVIRPNAEHEYSPEQIEELIKCRDDPLHFITTHVKIVTLDHGELVFDPYDYQLEALDAIINNRFVIGLWSRQSGKTSLVGAYALWFALFHDDKNIGIVSNKETSAKRILDMIKRMYENIPAWLKPGVTEYAKTVTSFDNGTKLVISATTSDAFRGWPMNMVICDEFAFVPSNQAEEFWASNYPTISSSHESKIILISTPNGMFNIFHRLWTQAEAKDNSFIPIKVKWDRVPGRNEAWKKVQLSNLGQTMFNQEFDVEFLGSSNTVIHPECLRTLLSLWSDPVFTDLKDKLKIWEKPIEGALYCLGVDPAKGTGENNSTIQVLKINSAAPIDMEQVAVFKDNLTDIYTFSNIIDRLSIYYNNAYIMCENNGEGAGVIQNLWHGLQNSNLVNSGSKEKSLGIRSQKNTKPKAVLLMKKIIEDGSIKINDKDTVEELGSFIEDGSKFYGKDKGDDLVSALFWGCYIFNMNILDDDWSFKKKEEGEDVWGVLDDMQRGEEDWEWINNSAVFN